MSKSPHPKYHDIMQQKKLLSSGQLIIATSASFETIFRLFSYFPSCTVEMLKLQINTNTDEMLLFIYSCYAPAFPLQILGNWVYHKGCDNHSSRIVATDVYGPLTFGRNN